MGVSVYWPLSVLCVCVSLCVCACARVCVWYQIRVPVKNHVSDLSKLDALLHKTHIKVLLVLRYKVWHVWIINIIKQNSTSNVAHHLFSQRNKTTKWAVGVGVGSDRRGGEGGGEKNWKRGVGVRIPLPTMLNPHYIHILFTHCILLSKKILLIPKTASQNEKNASFFSTLGTFIVKWISHNNSNIVDVYQFYQLLINLVNQS